MHDFRRLRVWEDSIEVAARIYAVARLLPDRERFGLRSQLERAVASIGANIAEGRHRSTDADFSRFLQYAIGSSAEVEHFLELAVRLKFLPQKSVSDEVPALRKLRGSLVGLVKTISQSPSQRFPFEPKSPESQGPTMPRAESREQREALLQQRFRLLRRDRFRILLRNLDQDRCGLFLVAFREVRLCFR
jgi:four helix bundle protein